MLTRALIFLWLCSSASAAVPVATAISAEPFKLNGTVIATPGVASWPLVSGDEVSSPASSPLVVDFHDGSSVQLGRGSRARIGPGAKFVLLAGTLDFKLVPGSSLMVTSLDLERKRKAAVEEPPAAETKRGPQVPSEPKFVIPWSSSATMVQLPPVSRRY